MKGKTIALLTSSLIALIAVSCAASELSWAQREKSSDALREMVGLPSIAVGNLNPAARNPGLELYCTSFYDTPGGYCSYFTDGVPFVAYNTNSSIQVGVTP